MYFKCSLARLGTALTIFVSVLVLFFPMVTWAVESSSITIDISPGNPIPYENTIVTLKSFSVNLDTVPISWFVNGGNTLSGIGKKNFSLKAPAANKETVVQAKIQLPDGEIDKTLTIQPSIMVLLWQANDSYVPPFYKGKALPMEDSEIKVVAMPEIRTKTGNVDSKNLTYDWKKDYNNDAERSGYGKNFYLYTDDYLENTNSVQVKASTVDQKYSSNSSVTIGTSSPKISFYKKDADTGIQWQNVIPDRHKISVEEVLVVIPYFVSPKNLLHPALVWNWSINDSPIDITSVRKNILPLKVDSTVSGSSKIDLEIKNQYKLFQSVSKEIYVNF